MSEERQPELPVKIYAEAVVRSPAGVSLLRSSSLVTAQNVTQFYAQPSLLTLAADRLRQAGFEVLDIGKTSINIAADPDTYERSFQTKLEAIERPVIREMGLLDTAEFINSVDDKPFGEIDLAQTGWDRLLDGVVINQPVYYHLQAKLPAASPPATPESYLSVPDGVAQGLNATLAHQQGITGKGVKAVMVDSGWYPHPFFTQHHYKVNVVLAPGSTHPLQDDSGHGTGESANLLAIAPDIALTVVKADVALAGKIKNVNSIAAFRTAVDLKPDIISCSWGSDQRNPILSAYNRLLAATVADAVRQGIIVIFSAGNGGYGFPAQHPEVIAAGGVYLHLNGSLKGKLEASNYASSFISPILAYKGRRVPDVCGLVGQLPHGNYILVPVSPGSGADLAHALSKDGTGIADGWAALSGTSAAAPQLAGVCALIKQINSNLSPYQAKQILQRTAHDVIEGRSNPSIDQLGIGTPARAGPDLATGYGLADAYKAVQVVKNVCNCQSQNLIEDFSGTTMLTVPTKDTNSRQNLSNPLQIKYQRRANAMSLDETTLRKLRTRLDEIQSELNSCFQDKFRNEFGGENIEIVINEGNFVEKTLESDAVSSLRKILQELKKNGKIDRNIIRGKHIFAAEGLLRKGRCQELAREVLDAALSLQNTECRYIIKIESNEVEITSELHKFTIIPIGNNLYIQDTPDSSNINIEGYASDKYRNKIVEIVDPIVIAEMAAKALGEFRHLQKQVNAGDSYLDCQYDLYGHVIPGSCKPH